MYNGSQLTGMTVGDNVLYFSYDASGVPMSVTYGNATYYYVTNVQGDVTGILNSSGALVVSYTYDAWGNQLSCTGTDAATLGTHNPLRYRGYVYDNETGLYYLQSRYYNPEIGRFINADAFAATGQGFTGNNMFAYCNNNPVNMADYDGYDAIVLLDTDIPSHIGLLVQDDDNKWWHFYWGAKPGADMALCALGFDVAPNTWCKEYAGGLTTDAINQSGQWGGDYEDMLYLSGNFSESVDQMKEPKGKYNLYTNNCSQVSLGILASADSEYKDILLSAKKQFIPNDAFSYITLQLALGRGLMEKYVCNIIGKLFG